MVLRHKNRGSCQTLTSSYLIDSFTSWRHSSVCSCSFIHLTETWSHVVVSLQIHININLSPFPQNQVWILDIWILSACDINKTLWKLRLDDTLTDKHCFGCIFWQSVATQSNCTTFPPVSRLRLEWRTGSASRQRWGLLFWLEPSCRLSPRWCPRGR